MDNSIFKKIGKSGNVFFFSILLMICVMLVPDLNTIGTETIIIVFCLSVTTVLSLLKRLSPSLRGILFVMFVYFLIIVFYKIIGISTAWWDIAAGYFGWLLCAIVSSIAVFSLSNKKILITKWLIYIVSLIVLIYVSVISSKNMMTMNIEDAISQESASYGTSIMLFSGISTIGFFNTQKKIVKLLYLIGTILSMYVTIEVMQRGTNVIMSVILLVSIAIFQFVNIKSTLRFIVILSFIILFLYQSGVIFSLLDYVANSISTDRIAIRINALNYYLQYGDAVEAGSSMATRSELMHRSLNTFSDSYVNVLFGVGDHRGIGSPVGNHSEILDVLARYGIIGFTIVFIMFKRLFMYWYRLLDFNKKIQYQVLAILTIFIARNFWGFSLTSAISILLFLYMPLVLRLTKTK